MIDVEHDEIGYSILVYVPNDDSPTLSLLPYESGDSDRDLSMAYLTFVPDESISQPSR